MGEAKDQAVVGLCGVRHPVFLAGMAQDAVDHSAAKNLLLLQSKCLCQVSVTLYQDNLYMYVYVCIYLQLTSHMLRTNRFGEKETIIKWFFHEIPWEVLFVREKLVEMITFSMKNSQWSDAVL